MPESSRGRRGGGRRRAAPRARRRDVCRAVASTLSALLLAGGVGACGGVRSYPQSMIVLGFDGMDHELASRLIDEGRLPNLARLAQTGHFQALGTSIPPQSPVAWSNFITGMDAGGHGIYDFVHRDPATMQPYLSTTSTQQPGRSLQIGKWNIPLTSGKVELLRHGTPFWEVLREHGVPTTIMRMPANFPPSGTADRELSGMGTPDIRGDPGNYTLFTSRPERISGDTEADIERVRVRNNVVIAKLTGPPNPLLVDPEDLEAGLTVYVDADDPVAKIVLGDSELILREGEWSDWVPFEFDLIPHVQSLAAEVRFYLKEVRPDFTLYATPVNIDPMDPVMPISTPEDFATELAEATGRFYTQGMPEDTNALNDGALSRAEFLAQAAITEDEIRKQYEYMLDRFAGGFFFYYFGDTDQVSHMMWRPMDPEHPAYDPVADPPFANAVIDRYIEADEIVGTTLERMPAGTTLVVMSDHGFTSWRRAMNVNTWLLENGYMTLLNPRRRIGDIWFANVDWSKTRAYAVGLNGLYINLRGREAYGSVAPERRAALIAEIRQELLDYIDPGTGKPAVSAAFVTDQVFAGGAYLDVGPDIIIGFAKGTRSANESALGEFSNQIMRDNDLQWSGDHEMDPSTVPGVLFTSKPLARPATELKDLAAALLAEFGIEGFPLTPER